MKLSMKSSCFGILLMTGSAYAADLGHPLEVYYPPQVYPPHELTAIERPDRIVTQDVVVERRRPALPAARVIEQRTVQSPAGVVKTTRIYEHYRDDYAPRPPRNVPLASAPYMSTSEWRRPLLDPHAAPINSLSTVINGIEVYPLE